MASKKRQRNKPVEDKIFAAEIEIKVFITPEEARRIYVESLKQLKREETTAFVRAKIKKLKRLTAEEQREEDRIAGTWALLQADATARYSR